MIFFYFWNNNFFPKVFSSSSTLAASLCLLPPGLPYSSFRLFLLSKLLLLLSLASFAQLTPTHLSDLTVKVISQRKLSLGTLAKSAPWVRFTWIQCVSPRLVYKFTNSCALSWYKYSLWHCENHWNLKEVLISGARGLSLYLSFATNFEWPWTSSFPLPGAVSSVGGMRSRVIQTFTSSSIQAFIDFIQAVICSLKLMEPLCQDAGVVEWNQEQKSRVEWARQI